MVDHGGPSIVLAWCFCGRGRGRIFGSIRPSRGPQAHDIGHGGQDAFLIPYGGCPASVRTDSVT